MALPANIRVNALVPFPALVMGSGLITIGKVNGVWTVGFSVTQLGIQNPPPVANFATDYVLVYDAVAGQFIRVPLSLIAGGARSQRSVTASPIVIATTDMILNVNINAGAPSCALPTVASRNGVPLTFKDVGGQCGAHNLTLTPNGAETIDGRANFVLNTNHQGVTLVPANDGVNTGWSIE